MAFDQFHPNNTFFNLTPEQKAAWPRKPYVGFTKALNNDGKKLSGVWWLEHEKLFIAKLSYRGEHIELGMFTCPFEAARSRDRKCIELYGEKAVLNFPREDYL